jgi:hypothetical protein
MSFVKLYNNRELDGKITVCLDSVVLELTVFNKMNFNLAIVITGPREKLMLTNT